MNHMSTFRFTSLALAVAAGLTLGACSKDDNRTAGQKLDKAIANTEQAAEKAGEQLRKDGAEAKAAIEQSADKAATAMGKAADKVADTTSDAMITVAVNAELAKDDSLSALKIDVDTTNGRVKLQGSAPNAAARDRATTLASSVKGVVGVDNQLQVRS